MGLTLNCGNPLCPPGNRGQIAWEIRLMYLQHQYEQYSPSNMRPE